MAKAASSWGSRFQKADNTLRQRLIWAGFGEPGTGKTTFGLGAPGPIVVQSFDKGLEGVVEPFTEHKDIYVDEYDWAPEDGVDFQAESIVLRDQFIENFTHAIQHARTVLWDKETDIWGLFKYAEFGPEQEGAPKPWEKLKSRLRRLINMPKALDINFGIIQGMKNEWTQKVNPRTGKTGITQTGSRIRNGMDDIEGLVHLNLEHVRQPIEDGPSEFLINVGKSRGPGGKDVQDQTFKNLSFVEFAQLVFPESAEEDWQ